MKKFTFIFAILFFTWVLVSCAPEAEEESIFATRHSSSSYSIPVYRQFNSVPIGSQVWMAENLHYNINGSKCYNNDPTNCDKYGHLYDWATAMALPASCNSTSCASQINAKHRGICPEGWHIPSNAEWDQLYRYADGTNGTDSPYFSTTADRYLKATSGWNEGGNGEDLHGFAALPGGLGLSGGSFGGVGYYGYWWSASESNSDSAYDRLMGFNYENADWDWDWDNYETVDWNGSDKGLLFSVRCLQDVRQ